METSLKTGFAQIFSCCPKNLSCPNFGGAAAPLAPPARTPMPLCISLMCCAGMSWKGEARRGEAKLTPAAHRHDQRRWPLSREAIV